MSDNAYCNPDWKNTWFHQELQRILAIAPKISTHHRRKSEIYISALYVLCFGLVCSIAPRKNFGALTTAPKFQHNGSAENSSATDGFFSHKILLQCTYLMRNDGILLTTAQPWLENSHPVHTMPRWRCVPKFRCITNIELNFDQCLCLRIPLKHFVGQLSASWTV